MNSRIREIVTRHVGAHDALIAELEAYHERAMAEAADGAIKGKAILDQCLGLGAMREEECPQVSYSASAKSDGRINFAADVGPLPRADDIPDYRPFITDHMPFQSPPTEQPSPGVSIGAARDVVGKRLRWFRTPIPARAAATEEGVTDIIERNATEWQHGPTESDDERARR